MSDYNFSTVDDLPTIQTSQDTYTLDVAMPRLMDLGDRQADGGSSEDVYLSEDGRDGGSAASTYSGAQTIDGGQS